MTAPTRAKTPAARSGTGEREQTEDKRRGQRDGSATRARSAAVERAYARRAGRRDRWLRGDSSRGETQTLPKKEPKKDPGPRKEARQRPSAQRSPKRAASGTARPTTGGVGGAQGVLRAVAARALNTRVTTSRTPFVITVMVLLAVGLVATLWLSIAAVSGSYQLQRAEESSRRLVEYKEQLNQRVSAMDSAPALAEQATQMGMVPVNDPARLVRNPDGSVRVVGEPTAAQAPPPPPAPPRPNPTPPHAGQPSGPAAGQPDAPPQSGQPVSPEPTPDARQAAARGE